MATSPPSMTSVLGYRGDEFDVDDIDDDSNNLELAFDTWCLGSKWQPEEGKNCYKTYPYRSYRCASSFDCPWCPRNPITSRNSSHQEWETSQNLPPWTPQLPAWLFIMNHEMNCFICDFPNAHPLGPRHCYWVPLLIEGLTCFNDLCAWMDPAFPVTCTLAVAWPRHCVTNMRLLYLLPHRILQVSQQFSKDNSSTNQP